jgi:glutathione synthase/RimK-type ligase-like ATP-grasp enzyme
MKIYDFGISIALQKDEEFVNILKSLLKEKEKTSFEINSQNLLEIMEQIDEGKVQFKNFLDLASFENPVFAFLSEKLNSKGTNVINNPRSILNSFSKAFLHRQFESAKLPLRKTFILSKKESVEKLNQIVSELKIPFVISPSVSYYENDIVLNAKTGKHISDFINEHGNEEVLVHEYVVPKNILGKTAWFRIIYSCGEIVYHWWDPNNHFYQLFGNSKEEKEIKGKTEKYIEKISKITGLQLFSTEIVADSKERFVIIDYANTPLDLGSQENERDAVPIESLHKIANAIANLK